MKSSELYQIIKDANKNDEYESFISSGEDELFINNDITLKRIDGSRYNAEYTVMFKANEDTFQVVGNYDSWSGTNFYDYTPRRIIPVQKTITVYEELKD